MRRDLKSLNVGDWFIVKMPHASSLSFMRSASDYAVHRVVEKIPAIYRKGEEAPEKVVSVGPDGVRMEFPIDINGKVDWRVADKIAMTGPFPDAEDSVVIAYARSILEKSSTSDHEIAVYITEISDRLATAKIVQFKERSGSQYLTEMIEFSPEDTTSTVRNALFLDRDIMIKASNADWRVGDLVCASDFRCNMVDGTMIATLKNPITVSNFKSKDDLGKFWPAVEDDSRFWISDYDSLPHFFHEEGRAVAAVDPDTALVLVTKSISGSHVSYDAQIIGHTGQLLYVWEDANYYFNDIGEEGLWYATNLKGWSDRSYEGEYDAGIDFDVEPATLEIIKKFGFSEQDMTNELREMVDDGEGVTTAEYIAKAVAAKARETAQPAI